MNGALGAGGCGECGHDGVSVYLCILAGIVDVRRRADKRGERTIRNGNNGALALLEYDD